MKRIVIALRAGLILFSACSPGSGPVAPTREEAVAVSMLTAAASQYAVQSSGVTMPSDPSEIMNNPSVLLEYLQKLSNIDVTITAPVPVENIGVVLNSGTIKLDYSVDASVAVVNVVMDIDINGSYLGEDYDLVVSGSGSANIEDILAGGTAGNENMTVMLDGKLLDMTKAPV